MKLHVDYVPEDTLVELLKKCQQCRGAGSLPSGAYCQDCAGEGRHIFYVPLHILARYFKNFDKGTSSDQI